MTRGVHKNPIDPAHPYNLPDNSRPDSECVAEIIEYALMRHGVDITKIEGTLEDAEAILRILKLRREAGK